jgi:hypothetical protein
MLWSWKHNYPSMAVGSSTFPAPLGPSGRPIAIANREFCSSHTHTDSGIVGWCSILFCGMQLSLLDVNFGRVLLPNMTTWCEWVIKVFVCFFKEFVNFWQNLKSVNIIMRKGNLKERIKQNKNAREWIWTMFGASKGRSCYFLTMFY